MAKVLHASYSGYFPSCLLELPDLATQSLEDAMEIYWKVKSWTIAISGDAPVSARTFTQTAQNETYLVCNTFGVEGSFSPDDEDNTFLLNGPFVDSNSNPTLYGVEPYFFLRGVIGESGSVRYTSAFEQGETKEVGSFTFFGQSYPLYRVTEEDDIPPASGTIEPASYWTYTD